MSISLKALLEALERIAPIRFADSAWDNVGLLLEGSRSVINKIMVCNDLTAPVLQEAISMNADFIVAYHPPWFRAEKRMTLTGGLGLMCRASHHGISVYSPHTALDAIPGGINDFLIRFGDFPYIDHPVAILGTKANEPEDRVTGYGRIVELKDGITVEQACDAVMRLLHLDTVRIARALDDNLKDGNDDKGNIRKVAVCAGSGGSLLTPNLDVDLVITGELSHHQMIALNSAGCSVILTEHSNSERTYLRQVYMEKLKSALPDLEIVFSERDKDPVQFYHMGKK